MANYQTRRSSSCPDGWEHKMPDGTWMCGKMHSGNGRARNRTKGRTGYQSGRIIRGSGKIDPTSGPNQFTVDDVPGRMKETGDPLLLGRDEYIINSRSAKTVGYDFLNKLNQTGLAEGGGFPPKTLPGSNYQRGGKVMRKRRGGKPMARGGPVKKRMRRGGRARKRFQTGGHTHSSFLGLEMAPPHTHGPDGQASWENSQGNYNVGDQTYAYTLGPAPHNPARLWRENQPGGWMLPTSADQGTHGHRRTTQQPMRRGGRIKSRYSRGGKLMQRGTKGRRGMQAGSRRRATGGRMGLRQYEDSGIGLYRAGGRPRRMSHGGVGGGYEHVGSSNNPQLNQLRGMKKGGRLR